MDLLLEIFDEQLGGDALYAALPYSLPRDSIVRQANSSYWIAWLFATLLYFLFSTIDYYVSAACVVLRADGSSAWSTRERVHWPDIGDVADGALSVLTGTGAVVFRPSFHAAQAILAQPSGKGDPVRHVLALYDCR